MSASSGGLIRSSSMKDLQAAGEGPMSPEDRVTLLEKYHQDEAAVEQILPLVGEFCADCRSQVTIQLHDAITIAIHVHR